MQQSDEELVRDCRRGSQAAWESLVKRYQRLVYTIPRRAGLDEQASSDVFQTVFAKLVEALDRIEQPQRIQAWLVTTAKRETWRVILGNKANVSISSSEDENAPDIEIPDSAPLPDEELIRLEQQHEVRTAVDSLDQRCRELLELLFYQAEAVPYADIASRLGITTGSIGPTRARCLEKLLRLLKPNS